MVRDWWIAHRFEFLVDLGFAIVVVLGLVAYWFWLRRRRS